MLQVLETDAMKDDKPYEGRKLGDPHTWHTLDKEILAKIKVMVEEWREVMHISLLFIALFLTVVTAFISSVIQIFMTPPQSPSTRPPLPTVPTQLVALFYYLALITSISNSVLCVLGMQWAARLLATPLGKTNLERALARERRMLSAEGKMPSLMGVLVWTLLLSIGFFVLGFLIQLWDLAFSFAGSAPILIIGGMLATGITLVILGFIVATTIQAALTENSPFESPLSNAMKPLLRWIRRRVQTRECGRTEANRETDEKDETEDTTDTEDLEDLIRWRKDDATNILALKTYAKLILNTNDAEVLDRAVPSFEYRQWHDARDSLLPVFYAVRERFLASDTSFRVKETVHKQLVYLKDWNGWKDQEGDWRSDMKANEFTRWCQAQCYELIYSSRGSRRDFFPPFAFLASLEEDNQDLRRWAFRSDEECIASILCTFDSDQELGDREDIVRRAIRSCDRLFSDGRTDDVAVILSHVDRTSVLRSLIRNPDMWWSQIRDLVAFIVKGNEVEILDEMAPFFSHLPEMGEVSDDDHPLLVCEFLEDIIRDSPFGFTPPASLDLSPILDLVHRNSLFQRYSKILIYYLGRGSLDDLSDLRPALRLWEYCRDVRNDPQTSAEIMTFSQDYISCFIPLPELSDEECDDLANQICALVTKSNPKATIKDVKGPILELLEADEKQRDYVLTKILSEVRRSDVVSLLIHESHLPWNRVGDLVKYVTKDHELEILTAVSDFHPFKIPNHTMSIFLDFLGHLVTSLPSDFTVHSLNLSRVIYRLVRHERKRHTWRKHTDTIIAYLDHGAFDNIDRVYLGAVVRFLNLCISESQKMKKWKDEERTSEPTRQRAMFYREKLKARAAQEPDLVWLRLYFPEGFDQPPPVVIVEPQLRAEKLTWTSRFQRWRNLFMIVPRRTMLVDDGPDIELELGTTGGLCRDKSRAYQVRTLVGSDVQTA
ncbi:hypothetical protein SISSUDRAFT_1064843 [Sistotremastrum suecicum HHB10207 ss-3]|uniref:DUF6535 domain-containing protein n=1 Tax=Sistotremastrum suecicum HHB10207 ss-3 TaxID=1314776 RepID=A0A166A5Y1_9AGAM|nr:hypothetical protein SISSUDRAFT_1064843 [Sistotremastrum suecicum HHB10207 ss-3]